MGVARKSVLAGVLLIGALGAAHAGTVTASLDIISTPKIGSGVLGTVTLTQNGSDEVDIAVLLAAETDFVSTGRPHHAFVFNLDLTTPYTVAITSPTGGIFTLAGANPENTPYGTFSNGINCPGCGPGASHANPGPLDLAVTDSSGISIADFIPNCDGYYFSADVIGPAGGTGDIATRSLSTDKESVPEPSVLVLLGVGLAGLAAARRRPEATSPTLLPAGRAARFVA